LSSLLIYIMIFEREYDYTGILLLYGNVKCLYNGLLTF
jgi:hypothetical protein